MQQVTVPTDICWHADDRVDTVETIVLTKMNTAWSSAYFCRTSAHTHKHMSHTHIHTYIYIYIYTSTVKVPSIRGPLGLKRSKGQLEYQKVICYGKWPFDICTFWYLKISMVTWCRVWWWMSSFLSPEGVEVALLASWKYLRLRNRMVMGHTE